MEINEKVLLSYEDSRGHCPFEEWLTKLRDRQARATIRARLIRVRMGNFGNCRHVGEGVWELKIYFGPGYRVYFARHGEKIVVLLCGGDKGSQSVDIRKAKKFWSEFGRRAHGT